MRYYSIGVHAYTFLYVYYSQSVVATKNSIRVREIGLLNCRYVVEKGRRWRGGEAQPAVTSTISPPPAAATPVAIRYNLKALKWLNTGWHIECSRATTLPFNDDARALPVPFPTPRPSSISASWKSGREIMKLQQRCLKLTAGRRITRHTHARTLHSCSPTHETPLCAVKNDKMFFNLGQRSYEIHSDSIYQSCTNRIINCILKQPSCSYCSLLTQFSLHGYTGWLKNQTVFRSL